MNNNIINFNNNIIYHKMYSIYIYNISGNIFEKIEYNDYNELNEKLKSLIVYHDSDLYIQLLINENILNNVNIIDNLLLSKISKYDFITIVFCQKKELYCLGNKDGKYILDNKKDNYSKLCKLVISYYENKSYDIIKNTSYKDFSLLIIKIYGIALQFISNELKNDKDVVLAAVKQNGYALEFASDTLKNDKPIVYYAVKQNKYALEYALEFASDYLKNDKHFILTIFK